MTRLTRLSLLEAVEGRQPFDAENPVRRREAPPADLPAELDGLVGRAVAATEAGVLPSRNVPLDDRRTSVRLTAQLRAVLEILARRHGVTVRELVQAVDSRRGVRPLTRSLEALAVQVALELLNDGGGA